MHAQTMNIRKLGNMVSEQVIPEEGVNGEEPPIQLKMRKENSVLEKDHHPLTKGSPNKRFS